MNPLKNFKHKLQKFFPFGFRHRNLNSKKSSVQKGIDQSRYDKKYFLSPNHDFRSLNIYNNFLKGGPPPKVFIDAWTRLHQYVASPILDIGCGRGEMVIFLGRKKYEAVGIDYSNAAISIARTNLKKESAQVKSRVKFIKANGIKLPFSNNFFKCIFLLDVVEHLTPSELIETLKEVYRVLEKNGVVLVHTNNRLFEQFTRFLVLASFYGPHILLRAAYYGKKYSDPYESLHINYLSSGALASFFHQARFKSQYEYVIPKNRKELQDYVKYTNPVTHLIFINIAWYLYHSPLVSLMAQSYWLTAHKNGTPT